ncbi:MAG TPA: PAS domain S-box protein, partial [Acetobacteraceae bacterium]
MASRDALGTDQASPDLWFQVLLETLPHIAFLIGADDNTIFHNQRFIDYLGFRPAPDPTARSALLHPEDQQRYLEARCAGTAAQQEYSVEVRFRRSDGAYRWHRLHVRPLSQAGVPVGWIGTAIDIHDMREANAVLEARVRERTAELEAEIAQRRCKEDELRASDSRFRTMYNRTPMALQSVDAHKRLLEVNDTWTEMFGYPREAVIGRSPTDFMTPESVEYYHNTAWPEMLASRGEVRSADYRFIARDNRIFDGRLSARGEFGPDGAFVRSWAAIADVTAEKGADRRLRMSQRMEAVGQVTAGIAHDFNNLLTAILGNLELLGPDLAANPDRSARLVANARNAAQRGARQTKQLLAFSRQQRMVTVPVDVNDMILNMVGLLRASAGGEFEVVFQPGAGLWQALTDPAQIELAVLNLAINARDAMRGGGTITLATANAHRGEPSLPEEPSAGEYVALSVTDNGSGIPHDVRERIFEPFFTTKPVGRGSGLGLPQVLGVVKQLNGG